MRNPRQIGADYPGMVMPDDLRDQADARTFAAGSGVERVFPVHLSCAPAVSCAPIVWPGNTVWGILGSRPSRLPMHCCAFTREAAAGWGTSGINGVAPVWTMPTGAEGKVRHDEY